MFDWLEKFELDRSKYSENQIGSIVIDVKELENLEGIDMAIFGVLESAGNPNNENSAFGADRVREHLYRLYDHDRIRLADLGNIPAGAELSDTYFAVEQVCEELAKKNVIPIIIGGSHDLTLAQFSSMTKHKDQINLAIVDETIDMVEEAETTSGSFLRELISKSGQYLFNLAHFGGQAHYISRAMLDTFQRLNFDLLRLGAIREDIQIVEPELRDSDMLSIDVSAIRKSDAPGYPEMSPNGLFGEEICRMMRYAGISDRLSSVGIYEFNPEYDHDSQTAQLVAQMVWYFMDGFYSRKMDEPLKDRESYVKYTIPVEDQETDLVFYKSKKSDRWWMELIYFIEGEPKNHMVSCTYKDYELAMNGDIPDRWLRANEKLI